MSLSNPFAILHSVFIRRTWKVNSKESESEETFVRQNYCVMNSSHLWENAVAKSSLNLTTQYEQQLITKCWEAQGTGTTLTTNFNCSLLNSCYTENSVLTLVTQQICVLGEATNFFFHCVSFYPSLFFFESTTKYSTGFPHFLPKQLSYMKTKGCKSILCSFSFSPFPMRG